MIDMKFSPEWLLRVANEEEGVRFSVGGWVTDLERKFGAGGPDDCIPAAPEVLDAAAQSTISEPKPNPLGNVFGQFLNMSRRERGMTVQQLAEATGMSPYEVLLLEDGKELPDPRIVSKVARTFSVPPRKLAQLVGHVIPDAEVESAALAFAASSSTKPLDPEQKEALHEFIKTLSKI